MIQVQYALRVKATSFSTMKTTKKCLLKYFGVRSTLGDAFSYKKANSFTLDAFLKNDEICPHKERFASMQMSYLFPASKIGHNFENVSRQFAN